MSEVVQAQERSSGNQGDAASSPNLADAAGPGSNNRAGPAAAPIRLLLSPTGSMPRLKESNHHNWRLVPPHEWQVRAPGQTPGQCTQVTFWSNIRLTWRLALP